MNRHHFIALVTFIADKKGEMRTPASSGYRAVIQFSDGQEQLLTNFNFVDAELVFPGDTVNAEITLINAEIIVSKLYEGLDFEVFDSEQLIGFGVISSINEA